MKTFLVLAIAALTAAAAAGCGDETGDTSGGGVVDDPQVPPAGNAEAVQAWLDKGYYKSWKCEAAVHGPIAISPHGMQRICSNTALSAHGTGEYPVDASGVKELYDANGTTIVGHAVYRHVKAGTTGDTWYWYEKVPLDHPAPHDANGVVADGTGASGPAKDICVSCHGATGIDADHPGHDYVYTQIK
jgi:hypothetical protein